MGQRIRYIRVSDSEAEKEDITGMLKTSMTSRKEQFPTVYQEPYWYVPLGTNTSTVLILRVIGEVKTLDMDEIKTFCQQV